MLMLDLKKELQEYIEDHYYPDDPVLSELYRLTWLNAVNPGMIAGPVQGRFLEFISRMINPERILEIGTFTGYSAICLARGLQENGILTTIEINDELRKTSLEFFSKAGVAEKINLINGNALDIIPQLNDTYDLIYLDAEKEHYTDFYRLTIGKLKPGGFLLADNALWDGKVVDNKNSHDKSTRGITAFNKMVHEDKSVENFILPFRDGIMMVRKIGDR